MNALQSSLTRTTLPRLSLDTTRRKPFCISPLKFPSPDNHHRCFHQSSRFKRAIAPLLAKGISGSSNGDKEDGCEALETVLKLYSAIKNRNLNEISEVIGDECRCLCNFTSSFQPVQGKKQVLDFFNALIGLMGNNIEIVVKPTMTDGMMVGVKWELECAKTHAPLGKGFSLHICHVYQGKVFIRNVEMFMEPLLHLEPLRVKIMRWMMSLMERIAYPLLLSKKKREVFVVFLALSFAVSVLFLKKPGMP